MLGFRRLGFGLGLSFAWAALAGAAASSPAARAQARPFLGPVPPPVCQAVDRTESGVDGQLTAGERASGASTRPYNCNLAIVGEYAGQGAGHQLLWYGHCAYIDTEGFEAGQKGVPPLLHPGIQVLDVSKQNDPRYVTHLDGERGACAVGDRRELDGIGAPAGGCLLRLIRLRAPAARLQRPAAGLEPAGACR